MEGTDKEGDEWRPEWRRDDAAHTADGGSMHSPSVLRSYTFSPSKRAFKEGDTNGYFNAPASPTRITLHRSGSVVVEAAQGLIANDYAYSSSRYADASNGVAAKAGEQPSHADAELREIRAAMRHISISGAEQGAAASPLRSSSGRQEKAAPLRTSIDATSGTSSYAYGYSAAAYGHSFLRDATAATVASPTRGGAAMGGFAGSSSSQAVLSALRSLQEKIRRLEADRDAALEEAADTRAQLSRQQAEHEQAQRLASAAAQERLTTQRLAFERLVADRAADDVKLSKAEEKKEALVREREAAHARAREAEAGRHAAEARAAAIKAQAAALQEELARAQEQQGSALRALAAQREDQVQAVEALRIRIAQAEAAAAAEQAERRGAEAQLEALRAAKAQSDTFLSGVLQVNEALVQQAAGTAATAAVDKPKPKPKKKKTATSNGAAKRSSSSSVGAGGSAPPAAAAAARRATKSSAAQQRPAARGSRSTGAPATTTAATLRSRESRASTASGGARKREKGSAAAAAAPFVPAGAEGGGSYNVAAAVSSAVRAARVAAPTQPMVELCTGLGRHALQTTNEVPHMFDDFRGNGGGSSDHRLWSTAAHRFSATETCGGEVPLEQSLRFRTDVLGLDEGEGGY
eukprot:TRINITY_DN4456_c0_g5_i1.p1 TRINITY_DN4456_c0_g5~~TRINITY_DN4456_c0_g5_i1.p1  ORF type:complete len:636 (+),score=211.78 TRINITY_DN4456_c0_g5_i1:211-2118(+)